MNRVLLLVCSMTLARRLQMHDHQSWSSTMEPGDHRVLPSGIKNEQCIIDNIIRLNYINVSATCCVMMIMYLFS